MDSFTFDIAKPLGGKRGTFVYLREDTLQKCIRNRLTVFVKIPLGVAQIDPVMWIKKGKRISKIFLKPDEPMILYGGTVPIRKQVEEEKPPQGTLF